MAVLLPCAASYLFFCRRPAVSIDVLLWQGGGGRGGMPNHPLRTREFFFSHLFGGFRVGLRYLSCVV